MVDNEAVQELLAGFMSIVEGSPCVHAALQSSIEGSAGIHIMVRSLQGLLMFPSLQDHTGSSSPQLL
ncbi:hypothetical protein ILYODFUR_005172, partial [Ilyodon furcidens]